MKKRIHNQQKVPSNYHMEELSPEPTIGVKQRSSNSHDMGQIMKQQEIQQNYHNNQNISSILNQLRHRVDLIEGITQNNQSSLKSLSTKVQHLEDKSFQIQAQHAPRISTRGILDQMNDSQDPNIHGNESSVHSRLASLEKAQSMYKSAIEKISEEVMDCIGKIQRTHDLCANMKKNQDHVNDVEGSMREMLYDITGKLREKMAKDTKKQIEKSLSNIQSTVISPIRDQIHDIAELCNNMKDLLNSKIRYATMEVLNIIHEFKNTIIEREKFQEMSTNKLNSETEQRMLEEISGVRKTEQKSNHELTLLVAKTKEAINSQLQFIREKTSRNKFIFRKELEKLKENWDQSFEHHHSRFCSDMQTLRDSLERFQSENLQNTVSHLLESMVEEIENRCRNEKLDNKIEQIERIIHDLSRRFMDGNQKLVILESSCERNSDHYNKLREQTAQTIEKNKEELMSLLSNDIIKLREIESQNVIWKQDIQFQIDHHIRSSEEFQCIQVAMQHIIDTVESQMNEEKFQEFQHHMLCNLKSLKDEHESINNTITDIQNQIRNN